MKACVLLCSLIQAAACGLDGMTERQMDRHLATAQFALCIAQQTYPARSSPCTQENRQYTTTSTCGEHW